MTRRWDEWQVEALLRTGERSANLARAELESLVAAARVSGAHTFKITVATHVRNAAKQALDSAAEAQVAKDPVAPFRLVQATALQNLLGEILAMDPDEVLLAPTPTPEEATP